MYVTSKRCYILGRSDYLLRADFNFTVTMTCTIWSSDTIYLAGNKRYEVSAANIAVDPSYYVEKAWSTNTNKTIIDGNTPVAAMKWLLNIIRWFGSLLYSATQNIIMLLAIVAIAYVVVFVNNEHKYIVIGVCVLCASIAYVRSEDGEAHTHDFPLF